MINVSFKTNQLCTHSSEQIMSDVCPCKKYSKGIELSTSITKHQIKTIGIN